MKHLALILLAAPACAETITVEEHGPHAAPFATIRYTNDMGDGGGGTTYRHELETSEGTVTLLRHVTSNSAHPCCPDTLTVIGWPAGIVADPWELEVEETEAGTIRLYRYQGG